MPRPGEADFKKERLAQYGKICWLLGISLSCSDTLEGEERIFVALGTGNHCWVYYTFSVWLWAKCFGLNFVPVKEMGVQLLTSAGSGSGPLSHFPSVRRNYKGAGWKFLQTSIFSIYGP